MRYATGRLFVQDEIIARHEAGRTAPRSRNLGGGARESRLKACAENGDQVCKAVYSRLSDGSLRFMASTTLFMQPPEMRPGVIIVDEPELGLHPAAISALAGMAKAAPPATRVILATQSSGLVDEFSANQVAIIERDEARPRTVFRRLNERDLSEWLKEYSLGELWEKNVLGGQP